MLDYMHTSHNILSQTTSETKELGRRLSKCLVGGTIVALSGELGSGKTTFAQGILEGFDLKGPHTSPTFVLMKQYEVSLSTHPNIRRIYHIDAYRVDAQALLGIGWEEWVEDSLGVVILEWPERVADIVPDDALVFRFDWESESVRRISEHDDRLELLSKNAILRVC